MNYYETLGTIGAGLIIATYLLLQIGKIDSKSFIFSFLNFIGSGLIIVSLFKDWNLSAFIIEFFWMMISLYGMAMSLFCKKEEEKVTS